VIKEVRNYLIEREEEEEEREREERQTSRGAEE